MDDEFYLRLENKFRGPRDAITKRLSVYLPIIEPLKILYPEGIALDVGCGRGEWLELLNQNGWRTRGVDANRAMLDFCRSLHLDVEEDDAIEHLTRLADEAVAVISGFHIAEHLDFDDLHKLVRESLRALKPGGILILETPNPENVVVGACNFYTDPTHRKPIPPHLMEFLAEDAGFSSVQTIRLNAAEDTGADPQTGQLAESVRQLLLGHPDYAMIAQKQPVGQGIGLFEYLENLEQTHKDQRRSLGERIQQLDESILSQRQALETALNEEQARRQALETALNEEQARRQALETALNEEQARRQALETALSEEEAKRGQLEAANSALQQRADDLEAKVAELNYHSHHWWSVANRFNHELQAIYSSRSWRITAPLRRTSRVLKSTITGFAGGAHSLFSLPATGFRRLVRVLAQWVLTRPRLASAIKRRLACHPALKSRLMRLTFSAMHSKDTNTPTEHAVVMADPSVAHLSEEVSQIVFDLKHAFRR